MKGKGGEGEILHGFETVDKFLTSELAHHFGFEIEAHHQEHRLQVRLYQFEFKKWWISNEQYSHKAKR